MNVLHLSSEKTWRGGEQQIAYLIDELERREVHNMVACRKNSAFHTYCKEHLIEHIALPFANNFDLITAWEIRQFCKIMNVDVVHMHSSRSHTMGVMAAMLGAPAKLILSRRVDFPSAGNWLSRFKYNYHGIRKILCVSEKIKEVIAPIIRNPKKLEVVYSGIDLKRFNNKQNTGILHRDFHLSPETRIIANISALAPHKDYFTFVDTVEAFLALSQEPVKFMIIGEGHCRAEIEAYIEAKQLQKHIILTGFRTDIADILPEIDVFLITSKEEGLGTTVLDAFASRVPVVATAGGGIPESVQHEETGLLFPIGDATALAQGVHRLLHDADLHSRLTQQARHRVETTFSKEQTAEKTLAFYRS